MGIDCPNISCIVHWGLSDTVEDYVQEIGRAGRNGTAALALAFHSNCDKKHMETSMVEYGTLHDNCKRVQLFTRFDSFNPNDYRSPSCKCCVFCANSCVCGKCEDFLSQFVYI